MKAQAKKRRAKSLLAQALLAVLAVALVFWLAVVLAWVPGLAQSGKGTIWAASLVGLCLGNVIVLLARLWKGEQGPR